MLDGNKSAWARPLPGIVAILLLYTCWDVQQATAESPSNSSKNGCEPARRIMEAYRIEAVGFGSTRLKESQPPDALADPDGWYSSRVDDVPHGMHRYRRVAATTKRTRRKRTGEAGVKARSMSVVLGFAAQFFVQVPCTKNGTL